MRQFLHFFLLLPFTVFAQITMEESDISNIFSPGNSAKVYEYDGAATIDIGTTGGGNNWDFSAMQYNLTYDLQSVALSGAPRMGEFPDADIVTYQNGYFEDLQGEFWSFYKLDGGFKNLGAVGVVTSQPGDTIIQKNDSAKIEAELPMTNNSSWNQTYTQTTFLNDMPALQASVSRNVIVDAYGTMTLPGGLSYEALRLRETLTETILGSGTTTVSYYFVAKEGAQATATAPDGENPSTSGVINVIDYTWNVPAVTGIKNINTANIPGDFNLYQNYPNPFNPATKIQYSVSSRQYVILRVFDLLGQEIETLVNEEKPAGDYEVTWNAVNLPSGVYLYKIQAGSFNQVNKMLLIK